MSCFSCSKAMKMVEDPIEKANSILQDLSGIVLDVDAKVVQDLSGIVLDVDANIVQDLSGIVLDVDANVIQDLSGIVVQLEVAAATISDVVEKGSSEIEELKE